MTPFYPPSPERSPSTVRTQTLLYSSLFTGM